MAPARLPTGCARRFQHARGVGLWADRLRRGGSGQPQSRRRGSRSLDGSCPRPTAQDPNRSGLRSSPPCASSVSSRRVTSAARICARSRRGHGGSSMSSGIGRGRPHPRRCQPIQRTAAVPHLLGQHVGIPAVGDRAGGRAPGRSRVHGPPRRAQQRLVERRGRTWTTTVSDSFVEAHVLDHGRPVDTELFATRRRRATPSSLPRFWTAKKPKNVEGMASFASGAGQSAHGSVRRAIKTCRGCQRAVRLGVATSNVRCIVSWASLRTFSKPLDFAARSRSHARS